jgi:hypothetical protein
MNQKTNQSQFGNFLFHCIEVAVGIDFMRKKSFFFTGFTHHNSVLWKRCGLNFQIFQRSSPGYKFIAMFFDKIFINSFGTL